VESFPDPRSPRRKKITRSSSFLLFLFDLPILLFFYLPPRVISFSERMQNPIFLFNPPLKLRPLFQLFFEAARKLQNADVSNCRSGSFSPSCLLLFFFFLIFFGRFHSLSSSISIGRGGPFRLNSRGNLPFPMHWTPTPQKTPNPVSPVLLSLGDVRYVCPRFSSPWKIYPLCCQFLPPFLSTSLPLPQHFLTYFPPSLTRGSRHGNH